MIEVRSNLAILVDCMRIQTLPDYIVEPCLDDLQQLISGEFIDFGFTVDPSEGWPFTDLDEACRIADLVRVYIGASDPDVVQLRVLI